jgi:glycosyltransferase involved in cell wall biosynthesis
MRSWIVDTLLGSLGLKSDWLSYHRRKAENLKIFDEEWYQITYADINFSEIDPFEHYVYYGWKQGRKPCPWFSGETYGTVVNEFKNGYKNPLIDAVQQVKAGKLKKGDFRKPLMLGSDLLKHSNNLKAGITICGFLKSEIGLGQAARNLVKAVDAVGIPSTLHDFPLKGRSGVGEFNERCCSLFDRKVHLICIPMTELKLRKYELVNGAYNILYPAWELSKIDHSWVNHLEKYSEVWTPSKYVYEMLAGVNVKVTLVRQPVCLPSNSDKSKSSDYNKKILQLLTYYDFDSRVTRKNIRAPIIAFRSAFPDKEDVMLTVKVRGVDDSGARQWLAHQAALDSRIKIIDGTLSRSEVDQLIIDCDVFLSLHRSEGFGFGAAEALAAGKAVVATDYSGTTDFITEQTGYPVEYDLIPVKEGEFTHWENQVWAEPRIESAVAALHSVYDDREQAIEKGKKGRALMEKHYSPKVIGEQIRQLLIERKLI